MSDFDTFDVTAEGVSQDPAAEFLAREQKDLAALDDEFDFPHINSNDVSGKIDMSALNDDLKNTSYSNGEVNHLNGPSKMEDTQSKSPPSDKMQPPREEPEKIRKWREEQQRLLEQKDVEERKRQEELRETAKHELEEWYARYSEQLEKSKMNNRNAEKEWVADRDAEVPGQEWEKIAKMCDFNPKSTRNVKDTTRMRSILLQLKQNPQMNKS